MSSRAMFPSGFPPVAATPITQEKPVGKDLLFRLVFAGEIIHETLKSLPKEVIKEYAPGFIQLTKTIERVKLRGR